MPTINLNRPAIDPGLLNTADLAAARQHSTGNVWLLPRRATIPGRDTCTGQCETRNGCDCTPDTVPTDYSAPGWLDACAPRGGTHAEPAPSAAELRSMAGARIGFALLLVSAATVIGAALYAVLPLG